MTVGAIAARELRTLVVSPLAWTLWAVVQAIVAWLFLSQIETFLQLQPQLLEFDATPGVTDLVVAPVLGNTAAVLLVVVPLITMRLIAEERQRGTLPLLLSAPVSSVQIVLGKYLGALLFLLIILATTALMPLSLALGASLDFGKLAAGLLGLVLLVATFTAVGLFLSCTCSQPAAAAAATFGVLFVLWLLDWTAGADPERAGVLHYLSLLNHFEPLVRGVLDTRNLAYFLVLIGLFLFLGTWRLEGHRRPL